MTREKNGILRRLLSILLSAVLLFQMLPLTASAATTDIWVPDGKLSVIAHCGLITVEDTGEVFVGEARVEKGTAVTITFDEAVYPDKTFEMWNGDDGTRVPQKTFRLLVERNTAFYPAFSDFTGSFGSWRLFIIGDTCEDGDIYIREDSSTGLKEYKYERKWHEFGNCTCVNGQQHRSVCRLCGYEAYSEHYWNSGTVTTEPTHTQSGVKTYTCYDCGGKKYEAVARTEDHSYGAWEIVTRAKDGQPGLRRRTCACGDVQESYYIKAEWEQYYKDQYFFLDGQNSIASGYGNTRDEWHYAYKTREGYDAYISAFRRDTGDTTTYAFLFIDEPTAERKPVYICRSVGTSNGSEDTYAHDGYDWALFHYVKDKEAYCSLMSNMDVEIHSVATPGGGSMQLFGTMRQWEEAYNSQANATADWWEADYTRGEISYNGFDCWIYEEKNRSKPKLYYVIKESNVCIYFRDYSSGVIREVTMKEMVYDADTSGMTEEELADWSSTHFNAEEIGSVKNLTFSKEKPEQVMGYRVEVVHHGEPQEIGPATSWNTRYEWCGLSGADDRYRFSIVRVGQEELSSYEDSFTDYMFQLQPIESAQCYFDHWEIYNPETETYEFYSSEETIRLNYITVTKDSNGEIQSREDYRIGDVLRFRGIYKEKTYHVKVNGGTFSYEGSGEMSEGDVPISKSITLAYDSDAIPEGYGFDYFSDQNGSKLYNWNCSGISLTGDMEYTAKYFQYEDTEPTYGVRAYAENGLVLMGGKDFYYGSFAPGTELTLTTEGAKGYDTFLGWYSVVWGKGKDPEYILLATDTTLTYTVTENDVEIVAKWSDGTIAEEKYHDMLVADDGCCFVRSDYERLAVSAVRIGISGDICIVKDPTVTYKQIDGWRFTGTNADDTPFEATEKVSEYCYFYVEETFPTVITVAGEIARCEDGTHVMDEGRVVVAPTYVKQGVKRYICTECGWHSDEAVPVLARYCAHACSVCGGCTLSASDESCVFERCTCETKTEPATSNITPVDFTFDGEGDVTPQILTVDAKDNAENPYVDYVLDALDGCEVGTIYDISLTDANDKKYTPADGETFTVTLHVGADNAQAVLDGRMYLVHIMDDGKVLYGLGRETFTADADAGTLTFTADSCSPFVLVRSAIEYYGRTALQALANGNALVYAYDQIVKGVEVSADKISVYNGTDSITQEELETVYDAYLRDHSEHFWLGNAYNITLSGGKAIALKPTYIMEGAELDTAREAFNRAVDACLAGITKDMSEFEREKELHDRLAAIIRYEETTNAFNSYGALVEGKAVCEGYAEAYQYLLQLAGIQSFLAIGSGINPETGSAENHEWNLVRIDGAYYHVDLTWDDQESQLFYAYFNKTDSLMAEDHLVAETGYELPACTSEAADYFSVNGGTLPAFDLEAVATLLKNGEGTTHVYVTGEVAGFLTAFGDNIGNLAQKLGLTNGVRAGYVGLGHELILTVASAGVTVSGTITSFGSKTDDVTIQLMKSGAEHASYEIVVKGNSADYSIENVASGTYTVKVMKKEHVTETSTITVEDSALTVDKTIYLRGDINTDGLRTPDDLTLLKRVLLELDSADNLERFDVKQDGKIDKKDLMSLKKKTLECSNRNTELNK